MTPRIDLRDVRFQLPVDLHWTGDDDRITEAINWLTRAGIPLARPSAIQLKIGPLSFYPKSGTLNFDNQARLPERGLVGLRTVLEQATGRSLPPID
ncbi:hypothetical protein [Sphingomonas jatrophae]|uniref:hypothetical protein n=1 Tax=Sphingomonas jatrophae TaxID=1166337 RepID=UPI001042592C|nr:hypothetical protein [Sphingomonas jatrophae]